MAELEPGHHYRLSDAERDEALGNLRVAFEEGRLDTEEHDRRTDAALRAVSNLDLVPLFEDLPRRLVPGSVTSPEPVGPAPTDSSPAVPGPREAEPVGKDKAAAPAKSGKNGKSGPNVNGLVIWGGIIFVIWGIPAIAYGGGSSLIAWLIFLVLFMVPAVTVATVQALRRRGDDRPEIEG